MQGASDNPGVIQIMDRQGWRSGLRRHNMQQTQFSLNLNQQRLNSTKFSLQNIQHFCNDRLTNDNLVFRQQSFMQIGTQPTRCQRARQHIGVEKHLQEIALNTPSSVKNPLCSASGITSLRTARNRPNANWRRNASRTISPLGRCAAFAASVSSRSSASSIRILKVTLITASKLSLLNCNTPDLGLAYNQAANDAYGWGRNRAAGYKGHVATVSSFPIILALQLVCTTKMQACQVLGHENILGTQDTTIKYLQFALAACKQKH